ncbi:MAG: Nif3-like dinuclear metal center hexameric protein [Ruminococcus sp.]|nr:Nif3-like dinuclear metal center hexameric protein [Ruminococcus sp.]
MTTVKDIFDHINKIAPYNLQESYDNSGLCVGNGKMCVTKALVALDVTKDIIDEAQQKGAQLIITHHPVIFRALKAIDPETVVGMLLSRGIASVSAHTNFDSSLMNDILCRRLDLHPSEPLTEEHGVPMGCVCELETAISAHDLAKAVKEKLGNTVVRYNDLDKTSRYKGGMITKAAVCSGSSAGLWRDALAKGCGALITGDVKHDVFIDAQNEGFCVIDAGHFHTENIFCEYMRAELSEQFGDVKFEVSDKNCDVVSYCV